MPASDGFFKDSKQPQTILKHAILRRYLATFSGATGTNSPGHRVGFLDGYAGPGAYANGTAGSPAIALKIAADQLRANRHLECIFVEKDPSSFATLETLVKAATTPALALKGDVASHLGPALQQFRELPALVFLDPYGTSLDRDQTIEQVLNRGGDQPTELLLNFSLQTVRRAGPLVKKPVGYPARAATLETMNRWLGGDWWQPYFLDPSLDGNPDSADVAANRVAEEYALRVVKSTGCSVFGVAMRRQAGHKALFNLMLFHPRRLAAFRYNEAVSLAQDEWREVMFGRDVENAEKEDAESYQLGTSRADEIRMLADLDKVQTKADAVADIKAAIASTLEKQSSVSVEKEFGKVFGDAVGVGRQLHLRQALKELAKEGVAAAPPSGELDRLVISRQTAASPTFVVRERGDQDVQDHH